MAIQTLQCRGEFRPSLVNYRCLTVLQGIRYLGTQDLVDLRELTFQILRLGCVVLRIFLTYMVSAACLAQSGHEVVGERRCKMAYIDDAK